MSFEGESYDQWRERTAPRQEVRPTNTRHWDVAVMVLLGLFFIWVGGTKGWIGIGLVAALAAEQLLHTVVLRRDGGAADSRQLLLTVRGLTLLVTVALGVWLVRLTGGETWGLPILLVLLDVKDDRSFLRQVFDRLRGRPAS